MLLLALALHGATTIADDPQRRRKARTTRITRIPARAAPGLSVLVATPADPNKRYRLPLASTEIVDPKTDAVKNTGMACGTTGAPWCPGKGTQLVKSNLGDN
jgi:hypothetical protein